MKSRGTYAVLVAMALFLQACSVTRAATGVVVTSEAAATMQLTVTVSGLEGADTGVLRLFQDADTETAQILLERVVGNGSQRLDLGMSDETYELVLDAPPAYFHEPKGYFFWVYQGQLVNSTGHPLDFTLVPPSAQSLTPCRNFASAPPTESEGASTESDEPVCMAEGTVCLSCPPKQPMPFHPSIGGSFFGLTSADDLVTFRVRTGDSGEVTYWIKAGNGPWEGAVPANESETYTLTAEAEGYASQPASYTVRISGETAYVVRNNEIGEEALGLDFVFTPIDTAS